MTVQELIDKLMEIPDKSRIVWAGRYDDPVCAGDVEELEDGTVFVG